MISECGCSGGSRCACELAEAAPAHGGRRAREDNLDRRLGIGPPGRVDCQGRRPDGYAPSSPRPRLRARAASGRRAHRQARTRLRAAAGGSRRPSAGRAPIRGEGQDRHGADGPDLSRPRATRPAPGRGREPPLRAPVLTKREQAGSIRRSGLSRDHCRRARACCRRPEWIAGGAAPRLPRGEQTKQPPITEPSRAAKAAWRRRRAPAGGRRAHRPRPATPSRAAG